MPGLTSRDPCVRMAAAVAAVFGDGRSGWSVTAGPPDGGDWHVLADVPQQVAGWHERLTATVGDRRAAAAYLAGWLMDAPATVGVLAVVGRVGVAAGPGHVWLHRHEGGWFDGVAIAPRAVADGDDALATAAATIDATGGLVVGAVVATLPIGAEAIRGGLADRLAARTLALANEAAAPARDGEPVDGGSGPAGAWARMQDLLDRLEVTRPRHRPTLVPVPDTGGARCSHVRATCCLFHRTQVDADPDGDGYCITCPLRTTTSRRRRLAELVAARSS